MTRDTFKLHGDAGKAGKLLEFSFQCSDKRKKIRWEAGGDADWRGITCR